MTASRALEYHHVCYSGEIGGQCVDQRRRRVRAGQGGGGFDRRGPLGCWRMEDGLSAHGRCRGGDSRVARGVEEGLKECEERRDDELGGECESKERLSTGRRLKLRAMSCGCVQVVQGARCSL